MSTMPRYQVDIDTKCGKKICQSIKARGTLEHLIKCLDCISRSAGSMLQAAVYLQRMLFNVCGVKVNQNV